MVAVYEPYSRTALQPVAVVGAFAHTVTTSPGRASAGRFGSGRQIVVSVSPQLQARAPVGTDSATTVVTARSAERPAMAARRRCGRMGWAVSSGCDRGPDDTPLIL